MYFRGVTLWVFTYRWVSLRNMKLYYLCRDWVKILGYRSYLIVYVFLYLFTIFSVNKSNLFCSEGKSSKWLDGKRLGLKDFLMQITTISKWLRTHQALYKKVNHLSIQSRIPSNLEKASAEEVLAINLNIKSSSFWSFHKRKVM